MIGKYVIVRGDRSGIFAGTLDKQEGQDGRQLTLKNVRRLWYWKGAASISQLAASGTSNPNECQFPCEVSCIKILDAIEILECSDQAQKSIKDVPIWSK
jgi:hypothetical protein